MPTEYSAENETPARARISSVFAFVSGLLLLAFMYGTFRAVATAVTWPLGVILGWGVLFALGLILWSFRGWLGHWIGNPTLSMVGGVAGAVITAVTLVFTLNGSIEQDKAIKEQTDLMREQLKVLQSLEQKMDKFQPGPNVKKTP